MRMSKRTRIWYFDAVSETLNAIFPNFDFFFVPFPNVEIYSQSFILLPLSVSIPSFSFPLAIRSLFYLLSMPLWLVSFPLLSSEFLSVRNCFFSFPTFYPPLSAFECLLCLPVWIFFLSLSHSLSLKMTMMIMKMKLTMMIMKINKMIRIVMK